MNEMSAFKKLRNLGLHITRFPSGKFGYVGSVPADIYFVDGATEKQISDAKRFGEAFGPKRRIFNTAEEAIALAESKGYQVIGTEA